MYAAEAVALPVKTRDMELKGKSHMSHDHIDEKLLQRIGAGDDTALEQLYEEASGAVYAYAYSILHDRDDAEDAVQDTFLKIRSAAHLYRPQGKPMAWILTITRNICMMQFRRRGKITVLDPEDPIPDQDGSRMPRIGRS